jgi:NAD+ synthase (glutamine-hydrolysing)
MLNLRIVIGRQTGCFPTSSISIYQNNISPFPNPEIRLSSQEEPTPMSSPLRIAAASLNQTPMDWPNNVANIREAILLAKQQKADLLLLPELCISGYGCEDFFLADWVVEKSLQKLLELIPDTKGITVSFGLPFQFKNTLYNTACLVSDGKMLGFSAKQHLANDGVHYEHRWFQPWPNGQIDFINIKGVDYPFGDVVYKVNGLKIAYEICEDMWHQAQRPAEHHCQRGVQIILNPSASPFTFGKTKRRERIIVDSTIHYQCAYVYANLLGNESGRIIFDGELFIAAKGQILTQGNRFSFQNVSLITHDFKLENEQLVSNSPISVPVTDSKEIEFQKAVSLGLFDYLRKSKSKCYVLSLSGGADSTACAVLVNSMIAQGTKELGAKVFCEKLNIPFQEQDLTKSLLHCAYQATQNSSDNTFLSAKEVAEELRASFYHWEIDNAVSEYTSTIEQSIGLELSWQTHDLALQNIQARVRAPYIWLLANLKNGLLITTSNRSEGDVGYCTMDGDTAGGIAPIAGVEKTFVQHWLRWAEKELNITSLRHVNHMKPTAELRPLEAKQTDEADLMPYRLLAKIEALAIYQKVAPKEVLKTLVAENEYPAEELKKHVIRFYRLWQANQWKRERLAPGFHLDEFNVDPKTWCRFPILGSGFTEELGEL